MVMIIGFFVVILVLALIVVVIWCGQEPTLQGSSIGRAKPRRQGGGRTRIGIVIVVLIRVVSVMRPESIGHHRYQQDHGPPRPGIRTVVLVVLVVLVVIWRRSNGFGAGHAIGLHTLHHVGTVETGVTYMGKPSCCSSILVRRMLLQSMAQVLQQIVRCHLGSIQGMKLLVVRRMVVGGILLMVVVLLVVLRWRVLGSVLVAILLLCW